MTTTIRSGRSHRLIEKAKHFDSIGKTVYVVSANKDHTILLKSAFRSHPGIRVESIDSIGYINWGTLRVHGAYPNCEFLFDHYALETYFEAVNAARHRFDTTAEIQDACKGDHTQDCHWCGHTIDGKNRPSEVATFFHMRREVADLKIEAASWKARYTTLAAEHKKLSRTWADLSLAFNRLKRKFKVTIATIVASNGTTYSVCLDNSKREEDTSATDSTGRMTPFTHHNLEFVTHEAKEWAEFLSVGAPAECSCLLCDIPTTLSSPKES